MKVLTVVLAICMLSIIGCSNNNDAEIAELKNQIQELQQAQAVPQTATPTPTPSPTHKKAEMNVTESIIFKEGIDAYEDEDYKTALAIFTPLAEDGHAEAQFYLGFMYSYGNGVPENEKTAVEWYTLAAEQGDGSGMLGLGDAYRMGWGVPKNIIYAHMWYNLSSGQGQFLADSDLDKMAERMTAEEITTAEQLAVECIAKEYKGCMTSY